MQGETAFAQSEWSVWPDSLNIVHRLYRCFSLRFLSKSNEAESAAPARVTVFHDNLNDYVSTGHAASAGERNLPLPRLFRTLQTWSEASHHPYAKLGRCSGYEPSSTKQKRSAILPDEKFRHSPGFCELVRSQSGFAMQGTALEKRVKC